MKTIPTTSINPISPTLPTDMPLDLDPTNPLIWILVLATFLSATEKPISAITNLLRVLKKRRK